MSAAKWFRKTSLNQAAEGAYRSRTGGRFRNERLNHAGSGEGS